MYRNLWRFLRDKQKNIKRIIVMAIINNCMLLLNYLLYAIAIIAIIQENTMYFEISVCIIFVIMIVKTFLAKLNSQVVNADASKLKIAVRREMLLLKPSTVDLEQDIMILSDYYTVYVPQSIAAIFVSTIVIIWAAVISIPIALIILLFATLTFFVLIIFYPILRHNQARENKATDSFYTVCFDGIKGMKTLKSFNIGQSHIDKLNNSILHMNKTIRTSLLYVNSNSHLAKLSINCAVYFPFVFGVCSELSISSLIILMFILEGWKIIMYTTVETHGGLININRLLVSRGVTNEKGYI